MHELKFDDPPQRLEITAEDGLVLKKLLIDDASEMLGLINFDKDHLSQFGDDTAQSYPTEQVIIDSIKNPSDHLRLRLGIWNGDTLVGSVSLQPREEGVAEVGYWLGKQYTGQAYAAKAVRGLSNYAFDNGYGLLFGKIHPENKASQKTLEKAGYVFTKLDIADGDEVLVYELNKKVAAIK